MNEEDCQAAKLLQFAARGGDLERWFSSKNLEPTLERRILIKALKLAIGEPQTGVVSLPDPPPQALHQGDRDAPKPQI